MITLSKIQQDVITNFPTYDKFFESLKPAKLKLTYDDIIDIADSIQELRMSLYDLHLLYTDGQSFYPGISYLKSWLDYLNTFSGINKPLSATHDLAVYLYSDYKHFYLTDLKVIFDFIMKKEGEYGKFYAAVDSQIIISDFNRYNKVRESILKDQQLKLKKQLDMACEKLYDTARFSVRKEFKEKYGDLYENMGKQITLESMKRSEPQKEALRKEFKEKYGI